MPYQGPIWTDGLGGSNLSATDLNTTIPSPSAYLQAGGIPSSATAVNPPVITQPLTQAVLLPTSGAPPVWRSVAATTVTCGTGSVSQDNYVDLTPAGTYVVSTVTHGASAPSLTAGNLRLYSATTNSSNAAVTSYTTLAATAPTLPSYLTLSGGNAAATVALPGNLGAGFLNSLSAPTKELGATTLTGDLLIQGFLRQGVGGSSGYPNSVVPSTYGDPSNILTSTVSATYALSASGPGGICTITPTSVGGSSPYFLLSFIGIYYFDGPGGAYPSGYRARAMPGFLISEIGTSSSQPHVWVDSIKSYTLPSPLGNGPKPQTWYYADVWCKTATVGVPISFAFLPLFG